MKIKKVEIQGFRAYKSKADGTFDFNVNDNDISNFIAIYAPNGFGKSSFYDAVEWGITENISRYITENNRRHNEYAAKSTKQDGVPQTILRNKDIDLDVATFVSIETTIGDFYKPWVKPRIDSMDLKFNESDTNKNYLFFRNVILSQDNIDRFIKEVRPENRYKSFMEDFCGDVEFLRRKLTILINENKQKIDDFNVRRKIILEELQLPVNEKIFNDYNNYINEVNHSGEQLPSVGHSFDSSLEQEIISISNRRKIEIKKNINFLESSKNIFIDSKSKVGEFLGKIENINQLKVRLNLFNISISKLNEYNELYSSYLKYSKDLEVVASKITKINEISGSIDAFNLVDVEINSKLKEIDNKNLEKKELEKNIFDLNNNISRLEVDILNLSKDIHNLETKLYNAEAQFLKSKDLGVRISSLEASITLNNKVLESFRLDKDALDNNIKQLLDFEISMTSIISNDLGIIGSTSDSIEKFYENFTKLRNIEHTEKYIKEVQSSLSKQMDIAENMASLGVEYINLHETNKCPLCQHNHRSFDELKFFIENNGLVSELAHSNAVKLAEILEEKNDIEKSLNLILKDIETSKNNRLEYLNNSLSEVNSKINKINVENNHFYSVLSKSKEDYEETLKSIDYMDLVSFFNNINSKIDHCKTNLSEKKKTILLNRESFLKAQENLNKVKEDLESISNFILNLRMSNPYFNVNQYLTSNNINYSTFKSSYSVEINDLNSTKGYLENQLFKLAGECNLIKETLIRNKHWLSLEELINNKNELEDILYSNNLYINSFCNSIKFSSNEKDYSEIENYINVNINKLDFQISSLTTLNSKFDVILELVVAIKPYSNSLKLKEELIFIENKLFKYCNVERKLSEQLEKVITYLSEYIKSFFYTDLINSIYRKIDPHPQFKDVVFEPDFSVLDKPCLNILIKNEKDEVISPVIYFSSAQLNILSLSVFLSRAINAKDNLGNPLDLILIDDPIQAMDSINILSIIDLLRSISLKFDKQIIISTHDENFYRLLQRKIPSTYFDSKFFRLSSYGVVEQQI